LYRDPITVGRPFAMSYSENLKNLVVTYINKCGTFSYTTWKIGLGRCMVLALVFCGFLQLTHVFGLRFVHGIAHGILGCFGSYTNANDARIKTYAMYADV